MSAAQIFGPAEFIPHDQGNFFWYLADLDDDGDDDIVGGPSGVCGWMENVEPCGFAQWEQLISQPMGYAKHAVDYDGDGDIDLMGTRKTATELRVYLFENDGEMNFTEHVKTVSNSTSWGIYHEFWNEWGSDVGDVNGDGYPDVVFAFTIYDFSIGNLESSSVRAYINKAGEGATGTGLFTSSNYEWLDSGFGANVEFRTDVVVGDLTTTGSAEVFTGTNDDGGGGHLRMFERQAEDNWTNTSLIFEGGASAIDRMYGNVVEDFNGTDPMLVMGVTYISNDYYMFVMDADANLSLFPHEFGEQDWLDLDGVIAGDYNMDGFTDVVISVDCNLLLYLNDGSDNFSEYTEIYSVTEACSSLGMHTTDFDNDGDLDILVTGSGGFQLIRNSTLDSGLCPSGCLDVLACNYDSSAAFENMALCVYPGCMDSTALNYDSSALCPGPCEFFGDFDDNGIVEVADLLTLLENYGCQVDCEGDLNGDGIVNALDILIILVQLGG